MLRRKAWEDWEWGRGTLIGEGKRGAIERERIRGGIPKNVRKSCRESLFYAYLKYISHTYIHIYTQFK